MSESNQKRPSDRLHVPNFRTSSMSLFVQRNQLYDALYEMAEYVHSHLYELSDLDKQVLPLIA